ncbi:MAG: hypothetical protein HY740_01845 [Chloroflexi bacterium]|nr:hypothetical protein [Chloroflexota bacterium]
MKAYELPATITKEGKLEASLPQTANLPRGRAVRLIVLVSETDEEEQQWKQLTAEQFLKGYNKADAIYDRVG